MACGSSSESIGMRGGGGTVSACPHSVGEDGVLIVGTKSWFPESLLLETPRFPNTEFTCKGTVLDDISFVPVLLDEPSIIRDWKPVGGA